MAASLTSFFKQLYAFAYMGHFVLLFSNACVFWNGRYCFQEGLVAESRESVTRKSVSLAVDVLELSSLTSFSSECLGSLRDFLGVKSQSVKAFCLRVQQL